MRRILTIVLCFFGFSLYAVEYTPIIPQTQPPAINMQPVNNTAFMSSGSTYSPAVYEVGAYSPAKPSIRKAPPSIGGESDYDPNNPQFAPLTDALIPLFLFALGYLMYILYRKRQEKKRNIRIT
jgi:hypothetical protein